jgi:hypothetical protein
MAVTTSPRRRCSPRRWGGRRCHIHVAGVVAGAVSELESADNVRPHAGHCRSRPHRNPLTVRNRLDAVFSFLHTDVLPHMQLEEETVYAAVDRILDGAHSMPAILIDHEVIRRLIGELDHLVGPHGWKTLARRAAAAAPRSRGRNPLPRREGGAPLWTVPQSH